jgi:hypothetical protein
MHPDIGAPRLNDAVLLLPDDAVAQRLVTWLLPADDATANALARTGETAGADEPRSAPRHRLTGLDVGLAGVM